MQDRSTTLFARACAVIPGGVNSPVRAFGAVGGIPRFIEKAQGAYMFDVEGRRLIDCVGSWGPAILGHAVPEVLEAVASELDKGLSFGAPCEREIEMPELLTTMIPWLAQVRMVNSGTEATMSAIRLARGATGRNKVVKFAGCYHGHADCLLVNAGSGALTFGNPSSAGVTRGGVADTLVLAYNDSEALATVFTAEDDIAAVIVEPVAGNMNLVPGRAEWLREMRDLCNRHGAVLIFDEVMSGFRVALGGGAELYGITPDLVCYGKVIGGGMPVGAFGGREELMRELAPSGPVYQAGTLSGNPITMTCGIATLGLLKARPDLFIDLETRLRGLLQAWQRSAAEVGIAFSWRACGGMFGFYFADRPPMNLEQVKACDAGRFRRFFHAMLDAGVYLAPSPFEAGFISAAHDRAVVDAMIATADKVFLEQMR